MSGNREIGQVPGHFRVRFHLYEYGVYQEIVDAVEIHE
jgi:hypothetical protein